MHRFLQFGGPKARYVPGNRNTITIQNRCDTVTPDRLGPAPITIVLVRMRYDQRTRAYVKRRTTQGKARQEGPVGTGIA